MNWTQYPFPEAPWDSPGLPPRTMDERCSRHKHCAYRDDDPARCPLCHASPAKCNGGHGGAPYGGWRNGIASTTHSTLRAGQCNDPREEAKRRWVASQPPDAPPFQHTQELENA
jgi:hypothetical protein